MFDQEIITKAYRELESLSQTSADAFAAERNRRFRRLLEHHVHNAYLIKTSDTHIGTHLWQRRPLVRTWGHEVGKRPFQ